MWNPYLFSASLLSVFRLNRLLVSLSFSHLYGSYTCSPEAPPTPLLFWNVILHFNANQPSFLQANFALPLLFGSAPRTDQQMVLISYWRLAWLGFLWLAELWSVISEGYINELLSFEEWRVVRMRNLFITHEYLDVYFYHIIIKPIESIDLNLTVQYMFVNSL